MTTLDVQGAEDFANLARAIRTHADRRALQKVLFSGLQRATKGIRANMKGAIPGAVPSGMAARAVSGARLSTRTRGGANTSVVIVASSKRGQLVNMNAGHLRHPVYGHRSVWVDQTSGIDQGFLDKEFSQASPEVRRELARVIDEVSRKVAAST